MMLRSGKITPRVKKPFSPRETSGGVEDLGPPARKASAPREGKSRWRGWREDSTTEPMSPLTGRAVKVHFERCPSSPASKAASLQIPPLGAVCFSPLGAEEPESPWVQRGRPGAQPPGGVVYFGELPPDEPEEIGILSPFIHKALPPRSSQKPPRKETPIKTRSTPESTLVLELEGILVCCSLTSSQDADCTFLTDFQGDVYQEFLETLAKAYEIFVFTTAKQDYTEKILDVLDPQKKLIRHRLYQQDCLCVQGYYVKDLSILERDLARTVALDDSLQGFPYQISNWIPIPGWLGDRQDEELLRVLPLLGKLSQAGDVRTEIRRKYRLCRLLAVD
ncbi:CTD small phosphatase-like protein 2-B isoform X2 [Mauremys reevesii]|uniref:CTD small phosphatase-like protein 2-B isoform X2 n=1 Tax=Mauremys reevesii TaxID=260615 RepID=UPI0019400E7D|nr:CTD small phosphatase-like protein 2-B isoform X2 [Mauremys reevesii]